MAEVTHRHPRLAIVCLLVLGFAGCSLTSTEIGRPVPDVDGLTIGETTRAEVLERLGSPWLVRRQFDGELYTWRRLEGKSRSIIVLPVFVRIFFWEDSSLLRDDVTLLFDPEGILRGIGRRIETEPADSELD